VNSLPDTKSTSSKESSEAYEDLIKILQEDNGDLKDLVKHELGTHRATYGDYYVHENKTHPKEVVFTQEIDHCIPQCLDYFFWKDSIENAKNHTISVKPGSTKVEEFFIKNHPLFTQLSDHYGVSTTVQYQ